MSVDLQCFFSECMLVMHGSRGGPTLTMFFIIIFLFVFFFFSLRGEGFKYHYSPYLH